MGETTGDLFGRDRALTPQERNRLSGRSPNGRPKVKARGYAALPGAGPADETCGSCGNLVRREFAKTYLKCGLMRRGWTAGTGSDVRAKSPACQRWEKPAGRDGMLETHYG